MGFLLGGGIEKTQGIYLVFFPYWYAIKPTKPFTKIYSVLGVSDFSNIGDSKGIRTPVIGVRGQRTNHYTIEPYLVLYEFCNNPLIMITQFNFV